MEIQLDEVPRYDYKHENRHDHRNDYSDNNQSTLQQKIKRLEKQRMRDLNLAMRSYARVTRIASYASFIVFVVMSYAMHSALITSETNVAAHFLAFVVNLAIAFITYKLVRELHPLRRLGAAHWNASNKIKYQINRLR